MLCSWQKDCEQMVQCNKGLMQTGFREMEREGETSGYKTQPKQIQDDETGEAKLEKRSQ